MLCNLELGNYQKQKNTLTTKFLLSTSAFEQNVELERSIEYLLDSIQVAARVDFVIELQNK